MVVEQNEIVSFVKTAEMSGKELGKKRHTT